MEEYEDNVEYLGSSSSERLAPKLRISVAVSDISAALGKSPYKSENQLLMQLWKKYQPGTFMLIDQALDLNNILAVDVNSIKDFVSSLSGLDVDADPSAPIVEDSVELSKTLIAETKRALGMGFY